MHASHAQTYILLLIVSCERMRAELSQWPIYFLQFFHIYYVLFGFECHFIHFTFPISHNAMDYILFHSAFLFYTFIVFFILGFLPFQYWKMCIGWFFIKWNKGCLVFPMVLYDHCCSRRRRDVCHWSASGSPMPRTDIIN